MNIEQPSQLFPLPENWVYSLVLFIGASLIPFTISSITPFTRLLAFISEARNRQILMARQSQGSYDKETILQSTQFYISPKCSNIDPAQEEEVRQALMATRESLFEKIDYFIDHGSSKRHLLILADSGTGKTSFVLNYYAYSLRRRKRKAPTLFLVYLGFKDADERLHQRENKNETIVFLDALDEDTKAIENHRMRIRELMDICRDYRRVIITCRTQFFPSDEEVPTETGVALLGPRKAGEKGVCEFWKLYLSPFDDSDINRYLQRRFPIWQLRARRKARELAFQVKSLSARPMLLAHIPDVVKSNSSVTQTFQLYQLMVNAWLERESSWVQKSDLKEYSELLSVNLYICREHRGMERIPYDELVELAHDWSIDLSQWQLSGRSLLNRDAQGNYKFAHRSIMEFLFVNRLLQGDSNCSGIILSDQMKSFLIEQIVPESISLDLKRAFRFLSRNEVFVTYVDSNGASCAEGNSLDQTTTGLGLVNHTTEIEAFLENLDYTSRYIYLASNRFPKDYAPTISLIKFHEGLQENKASVKLAIEAGLAADSSAMEINWEVNAYVREIVELVCSIEPEYTFASRTLAKRLTRETYSYDARFDIRDSSSKIPSAAVLCFHLLDGMGELRSLSQPERVHQDVRRFIELHGVLGLVSYHLINTSEFCSIRPKLPGLDQFELILMPRK
jgi:hypothetical protein